MALSRNSSSLDDSKSGHSQNNTLPIITDLQKIIIENPQTVFNITMCTLTEKKFTYGLNSEFEILKVNSCMVRWKAADIFKNFIIHIPRKNRHNTTWTLHPTCPDDIDKSWVLSQLQSKLKDYAANQISIAPQKKSRRKYISDDEIMQLLIKNPENVFNIKESFVVENNFSFAPAERFCISRINYFMANLRRKKIFKDFLVWTPNKNDKEESCWELHTNHLPNINTEWVFNQLQSKVKAMEKKDKSSSYRSNNNVHSQEINSEIVITESSEPLQNLDIRTTFKYVSEQFALETKAFQSYLDFFDQNLISSMGSLNSALYFNSKKQNDEFTEFAQTEQRSMNESFSILFNKIMTFIQNQNDVNSEDEKKESELQITLNQLLTECNQFVEKCKSLLQKYINAVFVYKNQIMSPSFNSGTIPILSDNLLVTEKINMKEVTDTPKITNNLSKMNINFFDNTLFSASERTDNNKRKIVSDTGSNTKPRLNPSPQYDASS